MKKNNSKLNRKPKIMSTKTKMIFIMSFLTLVIVGCVASMVIVLAAPKQKGILDVSIKYVGGLHKEREMFNGRYYYYYEMGEYPQTYAGAATSVTGLTETQEKFVCDMVVPVTASDFEFIENKEYNIWIDPNKLKYIKHVVTKNPNTGGTYTHGETIVDQEEAFFKIEPIIWDIVGYYTDDSKQTFIKASDNLNFNPKTTKNLVVISRTSLQSINWYTTNSDIDYDKSHIFKWLRTFENNVLLEYKDRKIIAQYNEYSDTSESLSGLPQYDGVFVKDPNDNSKNATVKEYAWLMSYYQSDSIFYNSTSEKIASASDFAIANYAKQDVGYSSIEKVGASPYWIRHSNVYESNTYCAGVIYASGGYGSHHLNNIERTIRPCLLINL